MKLNARMLMTAVAVILTGSLVYGCQDTSGPGGRARIKVLLTDAPAELLETAEVWISRVYLVPGDEDGAGIDLFNDPDNAKHYDLLQLRDGVTAELTAATEVEAGRYAQLRLVVDSAVVTLAEGYTFTDGTTSRRLFVPSGSQSGIKVNLTGAIDAGAGETTEILVDFDVDQNFVIQGDPGTPAGIMGILFTPLLVEKDRSSN